MITADPKPKSILNYNNVAESKRMTRNFLLSKEQKGDKACSTDLSKTSQDHRAQNLPLPQLFLNKTACSSTHPWNMNKHRQSPK